MKSKAYGLLAMVVGLILLALPVRALAHDHDGWKHHDHGHHYGWYKHHGPHRGWYDHHGWDHHRWGRHHDRDDYGWNGGGYNAYNPRYYNPEPVPPIAVPLSRAYPYSSAYGPAHASKLIQLRQTMSQRLNANRMLYQAAMARGNYQLANTARARMQNEQATINQADAELNGSGYSGYYGQSGYSPLSAITNMFGY